MNLRIVVAALALAGCESTAPTIQADIASATVGKPHRTRSPEDRLSCSRAGPDRNVISAPFTKPMPGSVARAAERGQLITSVLSPELQARLDAADTTEKIQALVLDTMNRAGSGLHKYSLTASSPCALTKSYDDLGYRESVCLQPDGIVAGNDGNVSAIDQGEAEFRKTINSWLLYVNCVGKACAVHTEGSQSDYMDSYFFGTPFPNEDELLLAAAALEKLAAACRRE